MSVAALPSKIKIPAYVHAAQYLFVSGAEVSIDCRLTQCSALCQISLDVTASVE